MNFGICHARYYRQNLYKVTSEPTVLMDDRSRPSPSPGRRQGANQTRRGRNFGRGRGGAGGGRGGLGDRGRGSPAKASVEGSVDHAREFQSNGQEAYEKTLNTGLMPVSHDIGASEVKGILPSSDDMTVSSASTDTSQGTSILKEVMSLFQQHQPQQNPSIPQHMQHQFQQNPPLPQHMLYQSQQNPPLPQHIQRYQPGPNAFAHMGSQPPGSRHEPFPRLQGQQMNPALHHQPSESAFNAASRHDPLPNDPSILYHSHSEPPPPLRYLPLMQPAGQTTTHAPSHTSYNLPPASSPSHPPPGLTHALRGAQHQNAQANYRDANIYQQEGFSSLFSRSLVLDHDSRIHASAPRQNLHPERPQEHAHNPMDYRPPSSPSQPLSGPPVHHRSAAPPNLQAGHYPPSRQYPQHNGTQQQLHAQRQAQQPVHHGQQQAQEAEPPQVKEVKDVLVDGTCGKARSVRRLSPKALQVANAELEELCDKLIPSPSIFQVREEIRARIEQCVRKDFPEASVKLFGSSVTTLCGADGDLDLCLVLTPELLQHIVQESGIPVEPSDDEEEQAASQPANSPEHPSSFSSSSSSPAQPSASPNHETERPQRPPLREQNGWKPGGERPVHAQRRERTDSSTSQGERTERKKRPRHPRPRYLREIAVVVERMGKMLEKEFVEVLALPNARIPIVKFRDPVSRLNCDMGVNNILALKNSSLIRAYVDIDPRVRPLSFVVKYWAKQRKVNDPYRGTLSSYAYVLMLIQFLQTCSPPILPCLQKNTEGLSRDVVNGFDCTFHDPARFKGYGKHNTSTLAELLLDFLSFYGFDYDYRGSVVSVRVGGHLDKRYKEAAWAASGKKDNHWLSIEDPLEVSHDLGRICDKSALFYVRGEFMRAANTLSRGEGLKEVCKKYDKEWRGDSS
eukprot:g34607.t1